MLHEDIQTVVNMEHAFLRKTNLFIKKSLANLHKEMLWHGKKKRVRKEKKDSSYNSISQVDSIRFAGSSKKFLSLQEFFFISTSVRHQFHRLIESEKLIQKVSKKEARIFSLSSPNHFCLGELAQMKTLNKKRVYRITTCLLVINYVVVTGGRF